MPVIPSNPPPIPLTVVQVISSALRLIGVLASGETADAEIAQDSLFVFQNMVDSWQAERLMVYTVPRFVFNLTSGQQVYTYGASDPTNGLPAPDFNADRPASIERMGIINLNNSNQPLELPLQYITTAQWQEIPVKNIQSALPQYCWDDNAFPYRNLSLWPIPNTPLQIAIYPWAALKTPSTLTTTLAFPPGYAKAFRYNLAVDLAAEFPVIPQQVLGPIAAIAEVSKKIVKAMNTPIIDLRVDPAITAGSENGLYNWISDMPAGR
jgi:hypothetical protein